MRSSVVAESGSVVDRYETGEKSEGLWTLSILYSLSFFSFQFVFLSQLFSVFLHFSTYSSYYQNVLWTHRVSVRSVRDAQSRSIRYQ